MNEGVIHAAEVAVALQLRGRHVRLRRGLCVACQGLDRTPLAGLLVFRERLAAAPLVSEGLHEDDTAAVQHNSCM